MKKYLPIDPETLSLKSSAELMEIATLLGFVQPPIGIPIVDYGLLQRIGIAGDFQDTIGAPCPSANMPNWETANALRYIEDILGKR